MKCEVEKEKLLEAGGVDKGRSLGNPSCSDPARLGIVDTERPLLEEGNDFDRARTPHISNA